MERFMPGVQRIVVQTLSSLVGAPAAEVPAAALRDYFGVFGIDLEFSPGPSLNSDPTDSIDSIRGFVAAHAPQADQRGPAVLVVADMGHLGPLVNGMLLDARRRGACAVFTLASGFLHGNAQRRFEIFAHELGHLLNLTHEDADEAYVTAMDSWGERSQITDPLDVWRQAIGDGTEPFSQQLRQFFGNGHRQPLGLPLSQSCCKKLVRFPDPSVAPWLSEFAGDSDEDLQDALKTPLRCALTLHGERWTVAQPLDFTVTFKLSGNQALLAPALLERTSGEMLIQIEQPDKKRRFLRPRQLSCTSSATRRLLPQQQVQRHDSLFSDLDDLVFPMAGRYRVRAVVPLTGSRSSWTPVEVAPASGILASPAMQKFLRLGMPAGSRTMWTQLRHAAADRKVPAQLRADFASRAAGGGKGEFEPIRRIKSYASPAVAQQDALRRVTEARRAADAERLHRALDYAEALFEAADREHPTLGYLAYVRRCLLTPYRTRR
jgi:hypothetical protein